MKTKFNIMALSLAAFVCVASKIEASEKSGSTQQHTRRYDVILKIGADGVLNSNEVAKGFFVIGGNAKIDGEVEQNAFVARGKVDVNGTINGDLVLVGCDANINSNAVIERNFICVGGKATVSPAAKIGYQRVDVEFGKFIPDLGWFVKWLVQGALKLRPFPPQVGMAWTLAIIFTIFHLIVLGFFPRAVQSCFNTIQERPATSFLIGIAALCLSGILLILLLISLVGIVVIPFLACAVVAGCIIGKIALYRFVGYKLGSFSGAELIKSPAVQMLAGTAVIYICYMIPVVGFIVLSLVSILGFGSALVAIFNKLQGETLQVKPPGMPSLQQQSAGTQPQPAETQPVSVAQESQQTGGIVSGFAAGSETAQPSAAVQPPSQAAAPIDYTLLPRVGFWRRFFATIIDLCVFVIPFAIFHGFGWVLWFIYHIAMWSYKGATIGDIVLGIKIVREDGRPLTFPVAMVRALGALLSAFVLFIGFFWAGWSREKKAWHDYIAGTIVVKPPHSTPII